VATVAAVRAGRLSASAGGAGYDTLDGAQRRVARFEDGTGATQCGEAAAVSRYRRVDGRSCAYLRGAVLGGARRVQAPRILLFPQLPVRHRVEGFPPAPCRADQCYGGPAYLRRCAKR